MIQFDEHIFQMGWFNHQLEKFSRIISLNLFSQYIPYYSVAKMVVIVI